MLGNSDDDPMSVFVVGSTSGNHVSIAPAERRDNRRRLSYSDVTVAIDGLVGTATIYCDIDDFLRLREPLAELSELMSGAAIFRPAEAQLTLEISGDGSGAIRVGGRLYCRPPYDAKLHFEFTTDQSYLPESLASLTSFIGQYSKG